MGRKDDEADAVGEPRRAGPTDAGRFNRTMAGLIVWVLMLPVLPLAVYERWRRRRERRTPQGAARERALQELERRVKDTLREMEREDRRGEP
jgi:hypothetical protein